MEYIYDHVKSVISSSEELFKVLAFSTGIEKQPVSVVFILSSLIADETCCNWIFHETKRLLAQSLEGNSQIQMKISEKDFDYIDLQKSLISTKFQDESVHYFVEIVKNQLIVRLNCETRKRNNM